MRSKGAEKGKRGSQVVYHEVLAEGERLGVKMPHLRGFQEFVEQGALTVNPIKMGETSAGETVVITLMRK